MSRDFRPNSKQLVIAKTVQRACSQAAKEGFRNASMSGRCTQGAIEVAIGAIQSVDVEEIVAEAIQVDR